MATNTKVSTAMKQLAKAMKEQAELNSTIKREGTQIILPEIGTLLEHAQAIAAYGRKQEEPQDVFVAFEGYHPDDALWAFYNAVKDKFGTMLGAPIDMGFFGQIPARSYSLTIGYEQTVTVPVGELEIPGFPVSMNVSVSPPDKDSIYPGTFAVNFSGPRMFEPFVRDIENSTKEYLKKNSIFKGKAMDSGFNFLSLDFDEDRLVYAAQVWRTIQANVLLPIEETEQWRADGKSLKRGVLLHGPYGTGKSYTARYIAKVCQRNGWSFINVRPGDSITKALRFARQQAPSVVFFEDIDGDMSGPRNSDLNKILNTIDGVVGKSDEVMCIMTTNHLESITKGMLRPGRLDNMLEIGRQDEASIVKLVKAYLKRTDGTSMLEGELSGRALLEAARGYSPAFIVEAAIRAQNYARLDHRAAITEQDVIDGLVELRPQYEMMMAEQVVVRPALDTAVEGIVVRALEDKLSPIATRTK